MKQSLLRELQLCELETLKAVSRICEEYGITYYLSSGTLLGAVRHQGFIPWDDDVDIEMPYEDYLRFLDIAQEELGEAYFVQNTDTDADYYFAYTKIRKNGTVMMSPWELEEVGNHGVGIDVFPLITVNGEKDIKIRRIFAVLSNFLLMPEMVFKHSESWYKSRTSNLKFEGIKLARKLPLSFRRALRKTALKLVFRKHHGTDYQYVFVWSSLSRPNRPEIYEGEPTKLPFEDVSLPVPPLYHEYLTNAYGDYMTPPPENLRNGGHGDIIVKLITV